MCNELWMEVLNLTQFLPPPPHPPTDVITMHFFEYCFQLGNEKWNLSILSKTALQHRSVRAFWETESNTVPWLL